MMEVRCSTHTKTWFFNFIWMFAVLNLVNQVFSWNKNNVYKMLEIKTKIYLHIPFYIKIYKKKTRKSN